MHEVELKFLISSKDSINQKLGTLAKFVMRAFEITEMYDNKNKELFNVDARLRVRDIINLDTKEKKCELTYKKPITREGIKIEEEIKAKVQDYRDICEILNKIGFEIVSSYERIRTTYMVGTAEVVIDEFPFGTYLEIEGEKDDIINIASQLGLDLIDNITKSCDDIYADIQKSAEKPIEEHIRFNPDYKKELLK